MKVLLQILSGAFTRLCVLSLTLVTVACVTVGTKFDPERVNEIKACVTTEQQIRQWFGEPFNKGNVSGFKTFNYQYGRAVLGSLPDSQSLTIYFNNEGKVIDFALNPASVLLTIRDTCGRK
jgi:outer membrane protein assembly factor BamE (lipoprotein component of BamABCDE complex)